MTVLLLRLSALALLVGLAVVAVTQMPNGAEGPAPPGPVTPYKELHAEDVAGCWVAEGLDATQTSASVVQFRVDGIPVRARFHEDLADAEGSRPQRAFPGGYWVMNVTLEPQRKVSLDGMRRINGCLLDAPA